MSINLKGHVLNQRQLDAIVPVMNDYMHGVIKGKKKLEAACVDALEDAGCPLGYDTGIDPAQSLEQRAQNWIINGQVGMSSKAIWSQMMGVDDKEDGFSWPSDPDDLNRCLLLLDLIPEWKPRMGEMARHGKVWAALAKSWDEITTCFIAEVGLNWRNGRSAPKTYELMKKAQGRI